jgi:hypothetical protein
MKIKIITATLLIICGAGIGWLAFENLMWAVWGKHIAWFEYVGFWGCPMMIFSGLIVFKSLRVGSILGLIGFLLMLFYLGPAVVNTVHAMIVGHLLMNPQKTAALILIIVFPLLTLSTLTLNIAKILSHKKAQETQNIFKLDLR